MTLVVFEMPPQEALYINHSFLISLTIVHLLIPGTDVFHLIHRAPGSASVTLKRQQSCIETRGAKLHATIRISILCSPYSPNGMESMIV